MLHASFLAATFLSELAHARTQPKGIREIAISNHLIKLHILVTVNLHLIIIVLLNKLRNKIQARRQFTRVTLSVSQIVMKFAFYFDALARERE